MIIVHQPEPCEGCAVSVSIVTMTMPDGDRVVMGLFRRDDSVAGAVMTLQPHTPAVCRWWAGKQAAS